jgi:glycerol kinase
MQLPVIAVFDIGKTNKKLILFDEQLKIVFEHAAQFAEIKDEDGLTLNPMKKVYSSPYVKSSYEKLKNDQPVEINHSNIPFVKDESSKI